MKHNPHLFLLCLFISSPQVCLYLHSKNTGPSRDLYQNQENKMSFPQQQQQEQPQPEQQQQQPVLVYPNTVNQQQPSHHSNGSFGTVFIVLAVIVVVSAIACFLGRLCTRRMQHPKAKQNHAAKRHKEGHPKDKDIEFGFEMSRPVRPIDRDIEFGFDKRIPTGKPAGKGENRGFKPHQNGEFKGQNRPTPGDDGEFRANE